MFKQFKIGIAIISVFALFAIAPRTVHAESTPAGKTTFYNNNMVVPVYFSHITPSNRRDAKNAMDTWNIRMNRTIFYEVKNVSDASIVVTSISDKEFRSSNHGQIPYAGVTYGNVGLNVVTAFNGWRVNTNFVKKANYKIYLHEFGHTIGLAHTNEPSNKSIMAPAAGMPNTITPEDVKTATNVYNEMKEARNPRYHYGIPQNSVINSTMSLNYDNEVVDSQAWKNYYLLAISNRNQKQNEIYNKITTEISQFSTDSWRKSPYTPIKSDASHYDTFWKKYASELANAVR